MNLLSKEYKKSYRIGFLILIFTLLNNIDLISFEFYPLKINSEKYPVIKMDGILINNGNFIDITNSDLKIKENGIDRSLEEKICFGNIPVDSAFSLLIAIDNSQSMIGKNIDLFRNAVTNILSKINIDNSEIAVIGFNDKNYLIQDFTNKPNEIINSLNNLPFSGSTNLDALFLSGSSTIQNISKSAKNRLEVILITDGSETGNRSEILKIISEMNARINSITLNFKSSQLTESIVEISDGFQFDSIQNLDDLTKSLESLVYLSKFNSFCQYSFKSFTCTEENILNLNFENFQFDINIPYSINKNLLPHIEIEPDYHYFGLLQAPSKATKKIIIKAVNGDINIEGFSSTPNFKIISLPESFILKSGESKEITIQFEPTDTTYIYSEIIISGDHCNESKIRLSGGSDKANSVSKTLKIIRPDGGEILYSGGHYIIEWDGILPTDTVSIDYSINNGNSWVNITNNAYGLKYFWRNVPMTVSNNCLIKISQLSKYDLSKNIVSLKGIQSGVVNLVWKSLQNEIYTGSTDGFIRLWNASNGEPVRTVVGGINNLRDFDSSPDYNYITYLDNLKNRFVVRNQLNEFEEYNFSIDNEEFIKIRWNPSNNLIAVACLSGNTYIYDFPSENQVININADIPVNTISWDNSGNKLSIGYNNGIIKIWDKNSSEIIQFKASDQQINSITFNPAGNVIANSSMNGLIKIWDVGSLSELLSINSISKPVNVVAWDPTAKYIASSSLDSSVYLWNPGLGSLFYKFTGHNNVISTVKWKNDGKYIASSTVQGEVFIWSPDDIPFNRPTLQVDTSKNLWSIINPNLQIKNVSFIPVTLNRTMDSIVLNIAYNPNDIPLLIDTIIIKGSSNSFSIIGGLPQSPYILNPKSGLNLKIRFNPKQLGNKTDSIIYLVGNREYRSVLFGFVNSPLIEIIPNIHDFGNVKVGGISNEFSFFIKNISNEDVYIEDFKTIYNHSDQFELNNFEPGFINPEQTKEFKAVFKPNKFFMSGAAFDVIYDGKINPDYISLTGTGAAPQINFNPELKFNEIICENTAEQEIKLKNIGNEILKIHSIEIIEDNDLSFNIDLESTNLLLDENDSTTLKVVFTNDKPGNYGCKLLIKSDVNSDRTSENFININAEKSISDFKISNQFVSFYAFDINEEKYNRITIYNIGNKPIQWDNSAQYEYFSIDSITPSTTLPNDSSSVYIKFNGAGTQGSYQQVHSFVDICGNEIEVNLNAYVGPNLAELESESIVEFPEIICNLDSSIYNLRITNSGLTPLFLSDLKFSRNLGSFNFVNEFHNITIQSGDFYDLKLKFVPITYGENLDTLYIFSNATNYQSGYKIIPLFGFYAVANFNISERNIEISGLIQNETKDFSLKLFNTGSLNLDWKFSFAKNYFRVNSIIPEATPIGDSSIINISFLGGDSDKNYFDTLFLESLCGYIDSVELKAVVDGKVKIGIKAGNISAQPGDTVNLPIQIFTVDNSLMPDQFKYTTTLLFNSTLLVPLGEESGFVKDGKRYITYEFDGNNLDETGIISEIPFLATLGNSDTTIIELNNSSIINNSEIKLMQLPGLFKLDSLCYEGGIRLIGNSGILYLNQNTPNPIFSTSKIKFSIIENGIHKLVIYDITGNTALVLLEGNIVPGEYEIEFTPNNLPAGNYLYQLITPSEKLFKKMTIAR